MNENHYMRIEAVTLIRLLTVRRPATFFTHINDFVLTMGKRAIQYKITVTHDRYSFANLRQINVKIQVPLHRRKVETVEGTHQLDGLD